MLADRVDIGRVAQAKLEIDGCSDTHQFGNFVEADEAAQIVRDLHVDIQGDVYRLANGGDLCQREVGGNVKGIGAQLLHQANGSRVGGSHHHAYFELHVLRQHSGAAHLT